MLGVTMASALALAPLVPAHAAGSGMLGDVLAGLQVGTLSSLVNAGVPRSSAGTVVHFPTTTTTRATPPTAATPVQAAAVAPQLAASYPVSPRCRAARGDVEAAGLALPIQFEFRCPGSTELYAGERQHWGTACSMASLCPGSSYIAVNPGLVGPSEGRLRYVVAHETCHAVDAAAGRPMNELAADACAARHGFPRV